MAARRRHRRLRSHDDPRHRALGGHPRNRGRASHHPPRPGTAVDLAWAPDGRALYVADRRTAAAPSAVARIEVRNGGRRWGTGPPTGTYGDRDLALSPEGDRIAFARAVVPGLEDLYVAAVAGGAPRRLTHDGASINGLAWLPGSDEILFSSNRDGTNRLWRGPGARQYAPHPCDRPARWRPRSGVFAGCRPPGLRATDLRYRLWASRPRRAGHPPPPTHRTPRPGGMRRHPLRVRGVAWLSSPTAQAPQHPGSLGGRAPSPSPAAAVLARRTPRLSAGRRGPPTADGWPWRRSAPVRPTS
jgi:hypothetical protein